MNAREMVNEIVSCFVPPPKPMQEKMITLVESIPEAARKNVIDRIVETESSSIKISIKNIVEACIALGVSYHKTTYVPAEAWICDSCGNQFKYGISPSDDDKIDKLIYDACPMCGFQVNWSILHKQYSALGIKTEWYDRLLAECFASFGPKIAPHVSKKIPGLSLSRGGIFWSRSKAENERSDDKKLSIANKLAEIDKAKRYDLRDE